MKTDNLSVIRSRLWHSAEMAHVRLQLIAMAIGWAVALVICLPGAAGVPGVLHMQAAFVSLFFAPFVIFWLWRTFRIFQSAQEYVFCRTELSQPHHAPLGRGLFSFMGIIETEEDGRFPVETHAVFQGAGWGLVMEEYLGKTVTLAWNRETNMVVVIG